MAFRFHRNVSKECHAQSDVKIQRIDSDKLSDTEVFKLEYLLFATELFLDSPPGKVRSGDADHIVL